MRLGARLVKALFVCPRVVCASLLSTPLSFTFVRQIELTTKMLQTVQISWVHGRLLKDYTSSLLKGILPPLKVWGWTYLAPAPAASMLCIFLCLPANEHLQIAEVIDEKNKTLDFDVLYMAKNKNLQQSFSITVQAGAPASLKVCPAALRALQTATPFHLIILSPPPLRLLPLSPPFPLSPIARSTSASLVWPGASPCRRRRPLSCLLSVSPWLRALQLCMLAPAVDINPHDRFSRRCAWQRLQISRPG